MVTGLCFVLAPFAVPAVAQSSSKKVQSSKTQSSKKKGGKVAARPRSRPTPRSRRMHAAFVASTSLKPMARQLLQDRTQAAYAGVEAYARRHNQEDAGALAWLVLGYAHILDKDYVRAVDPLSRAKPQAGDLGEYVTFYRGTTYFQSGRTA
jgi:soluble lytic murein transglycosylase